mgnify:CR=1 FL=1
MAELAKDELNENKRQFNAEQLHDVNKLQDRLIKKGVQVFAKRVPWSDIVGGWNRDHKSGILAPLTFGKTINFKNQRLVGDIKYLWEPNRHHHLVTIAQAYYLTKNNKYWENRDFQGFTKYDRIKKRAFPADIQNPILNLYINNGLSAAEAYIDIKKFHKNLLDFKDHK